MLYAGFYSDLPPFRLVLMSTSPHNKTTNTMADTSQTQARYLAVVLMIPLTYLLYHIGLAVTGLFWGGIPFPLTFDADATLMTMEVVGRAMLVIPWLVFIIFIGALCCAYFGSMALMAVMAIVIPAAWIVGVCTGTDVLADETPEPA